MFLAMIVFLFHASSLLFLNLYHRITGDVQCVALILSFVIICYRNPLEYMMVFLLYALL